MHMHWASASCAAWQIESRHKTVINWLPWTASARVVSEPCFFSCCVEGFGHGLTSLCRLWGSKWSHQCVCAAVVCICCVLFSLPATTYIYIYTSSMHVRCLSSPLSSPPTYIMSAATTSTSKHSGKKWLCVHCHESFDNRGRRDYHSKFKCVQNPVSAMEFHIKGN